jgi:hypothetical protein
MSDHSRSESASAETSLAQNLGSPGLIALAYTIERKRTEYYTALERNNKDMEITDWLTYYANTILEAQRSTIKRVDFFVAKVRFYETFRDQLNERQDKVIARMFKEGIEGFRGGLSVENYITSRRPLHHHHEDLARHRDPRSTRPCREGCTYQGRRVAAHAIFPACRTAPRLKSVAQAASSC